MHFAPVTKAAGTAGTAEGSTPLNAFDNALLAAGIGNINLIKVSSILPPGVELVPLPRIKPGALVPTAYAAMTSEVPGEVVAAAVGWARPIDPAKNGVIMEYQGGCVISFDESFEKDRHGEKERYCKCEPGNCQGTDATEPDF